MKIEEFLEDYLKIIKELSINSVLSLISILEDKGLEFWIRFDKREHCLKIKAIVKKTNNRKETIWIEYYENKDLEDYLFDVLELKNSFYKVGLDID